MDCVPLGAMVEINQVVTFGDSWPYGTELPIGGETYGQIIANYYHAEFKNYSKPATSNKHQILQLKNFITENKDLNDNIAIFFMTSIARSLHIDYDETAVTVRPTRNFSEGDRNYYYYKYFHTPSSEQFDFYTTVLSLQRMCSQHNIKDFYIAGWQKPDCNFPGIDKSKIYQFGDTNCTEMFGYFGGDEFDQDPTNKFVFPNVCHPNQLGHQTIAENLIAWIEQNENTLS